MALRKQQGRERGGTVVWGAAAAARPVRARQVAKARSRHAALERAERLYPIVTEFVTSGLSYRAMVDRLNQRREPAPSGHGRWHLRTLQRLVALAPAIEARGRCDDSAFARSAEAIETARALREIHHQLRDRAVQLTVRAAALCGMLHVLRLTVVQTRTLVRRP